jgi:hypothetical protein
MSSSYHCGRAPATACLLAVGLGASIGAADAREPFSDNLRYTFDAATRGVWMDDGTDAAAHFIGLDLHKVFSTDSGDVATLTLQPYLIKLDDMAMHPPFFDGPDDTAIEYRIFNVNVTKWGRGRTNLRLGHFEVPFGLEQVINTNGTLRDYLHGANIGVKADWGVSLNGELPRFEYEVGVTRGSGNNWSSRGDPHLVAGRVGTARVRPWVVGLSMLDGEVRDLSQPDFTTERSRTGVDVQWHGARFDFMAEAAAGSDESRPARSTLIELDTASRNGVLNGYLQWVNLEQDALAALPRERTRSVNLGLLFTPDSHWAVSAQWSHVLMSTSQPEGSMLAGQARYRLR